MTDFLSVAQMRQSCRRYQRDKAVEQEKLDRILEAARLAPSACNGQPYHVTVCRGDIAKAVAKATMGMGMNRFAADAPIMLVISERPYVATAALGARVKHNDYRSIDIGIVAAYITAQATTEGLATCMLGWFDAKTITQLCALDGQPRLVITLGYAAADDKLRDKKRLPLEKLVTDLADA